MPTSFEPAFRRVRRLRLGVDHASNSSRIRTSSILLSTWRSYLRVEGGEGGGEVREREEEEGGEIKKGDKNERTNNQTNLRKNEKVRKELWILTFILDSLLLHLRDDLLMAFDAFGLLGNSAPIH